MIDQDLIMIDLIWIHDWSWLKSWLIRIEAMIYSTKAIWLIRIEAILIYMIILDLSGLKSWLIRIEAMIDSIE